MKTFLITYTLEAFDDSFPTISEKIKEYPKWARISQYAWLIQSNKSVSDVRSELKTAINEKGTILVIDVSSAAWATFAVNKQVTEWMKENL